MKMEVPVPVKPPSYRCSRCLLVLLLFVCLLPLSWRLLRPCQGPDWEARYSEMPKERVLPQSIIIGARKCGTRALLDFLQVHPQIRAAKEEIHFFDDADNFDRGLGWYREQMPPSVPGQVTMEKSPAYFVTEEVPERVWHMNKSIKLVLIVRDPVTRVVSDYAQVASSKRRRGKPVRPLEKMITRGGRVNTRVKMVRTSLYHRHLSRWLQLFNSSQIHIVDGDELIRNPGPEVRKVEAFLGLSPYLDPQRFVFNATKGFYCVRRRSGTEHCLGSAKGRKHPPVSPRLLKKLREFYAQEDRRLSELTGRTFLWMKSP